MASTAFQSQQEVFHQESSETAQFITKKKKPGINKMVTSLSNLFEEAVRLSNNLLVMNYKFYVDCVK